MVGPAKNQRKAKITSRERPCNKNLRADPSTRPLARQAKTLTPAIAHEMNEILEFRKSHGLPTFNMNQGLVKTDQSISEINCKTLQSADPSVLWEMGRIPGLDSLRREVAGWRQELFKEQISAENVFITVGASNAFLLNLLALTNFGDKIQYIAPYFFNHLNAGKLFDRTPVEIPLIEDQDFAFDHQLIEDKWDRKTKLLILSNPHNPTGIYFPPTQISELEQTVSRLGGWLVIDESYTGFQHDPAAPTMSGLILESTLVQGSFSKVLSLGDLRIGYLIAPTKLIEVFTRIQDNLVICPSVLNQQIALAVLQNRQELLPNLSNEMRLRSSVFNRALSELSPKLRVTGDSGVFKWIYLGDEIDDEQFILKLAQTTGIIGTPGRYYGAPHWIRLTYGMLNDVDQLLESCTRLLPILNSLHPKADSEKASLDEIFESLSVSNKYTNPEHQFTSLANEIEVYSQAEEQKFNPSISLFKYSQEKAVKK